MPTPSMYIDNTWIKADIIANVGWKNLNVLNPCNV